MAQDPTSGMKDVSSCVKDAVPGYPRLAEGMAHAPETSIFRMYGALGRRFLMYDQAEVVDVYRKLIEVEQTDYKSIDGDKSKYSSNYMHLKHSESDMDHVQWKLIKELERAYDKYS